MNLLLAAAVLGVGLIAALAWCTTRVVRALRALEQQAEAARAVSLITVFAPGLAAAHHDPRALLVWEPLAATARRLLPTEFAALDRAHSGTFPFNRSEIEAAHARWTTEWLAWERAHDADFKLKAAAAEQEIPAGGALARARLDAVEREKLEQYQRRYEEYVRVARALQALTREG